MKLTFLFIILIAIVVAAAYGANNWQKYGSFWSKDAKDMDLSQLISLGNLNNGKTVCTKGYYMETPGTTVIATSLNSEIYKNSIWVNNVSGKQFFIDALKSGGRAAMMRMCGKFEYGSGFGQPSVWNKQIDVSEFEQLDKTIPL